MSRASRPFAASALLSCLIAATILAGCSLERRTHGHPVSTDLFPTIVPKETTKAQVLTMLGAPTAIEQRVGGTCFTYSYRTSSGSEAQLSFFQASASYSTDEAVEQKLMIWFDRKGIVVEIAAQVVKER